MQKLEYQMYKFEICFMIHVSENFQLHFERKRIKIFKKESKDYFEQINQKRD